MTEFYFSDFDSDFCYPLEFWDDFLEFENYDEIKLFKAVYIGKETGCFFCKYFECIGEKGDDACGKFCSGYEPRNKKSGCCRFYSVRFYKAGDEIKILRRKNL